MRPPLSIVASFAVGLLLASAPFVYLAAGGDPGTRGGPMYSIPSVNALLSCLLVLIGLGVVILAFVDCFRFLTGKGEMETSSLTSRSPAFVALPVVALGLLVLDARLKTQIFFPSAFVILVIVGTARYLVLVGKRAWDHHRLFHREGGHPPVGDPPVCGRCGYDLSTPIPDRCPQCGIPIIMELFPPRV